MILVNCPRCEEELEVDVLSCTEATYWQPADFDWELTENHECEDEWTEREQSKLSEEIYNSYQENRYDGRY
jgi:hypothetical protein